MATAYLTNKEFKLRAVIPAEYIDAVDQLQPGWLDTQLNVWSRWIDSRLRKRYAVPFADPAPEMAKSWLARIVQLRVLLRRGIDPTDAQYAEFKNDHDSALTEIKEAADSNEGLFELPLVETTPNTSGVSQGSPRSYSEQSPYVTFDMQRRTGEAEDSMGRGSCG